MEFSRRCKPRETEMLMLFRAKKCCEKRNEEAPWLTRRFGYWGPQQSVAENGSDGSTNTGNKGVPKIIINDTQ